LTVEPEVGQETLVQRLHASISRRASSPELTGLGDDLPCDPRRFETVAREVLEGGGPGSSLLAGFGLAQPGSERFDDTWFRTMNGAGHQRFLKFARQIAEQTTAEHLERCLFGRWRYNDPGPTLRFDAADDRRYALRADDPASTSSDAPIRTVRGANALALEGLALLPVLPTVRGAATPLFRRDDGSVFVRWPIWERPLLRDAAASLLARPTNAALPGVAAVFEARRLRLEQGRRSFTPARRIR
jgi:hypothetical protein